MTIEWNVSDYRIVIDQRAIEKLIGGSDVTEALQVIGGIGEAGAKRFAPVDTGNLRRSITHELGQRGLDRYVRIGTNVNYAAFQELGTRYHAAQPYLRPAIEEIRRAIR